MSDAAKNQEKPQHVFNTIRVQAVGDFEDPDRPGNHYTANEMFELPRAHGLKLVSMGLVKEAPVLVRFKTGWGSYQPGELAGFAPKRAFDLVVTRKIAVYEQAYQDERATSSATERIINTAVDITKIGWKEAVEVVEACTSVKQLEEWMQADRRKAVHEAIEKRLGELASGGGGATA